LKKNLSANTALLGLFVALVIPSVLVAQQRRYKLIDMGTFGGPNSYLNDENHGNNAAALVNNRGTLVGWADTSAPDLYQTFCFSEDCFVSHAFQWHAGVRTDLGALIDGLSSQANWISESGLIVGVAENGEIDPLLSGFPELRAVLWRNGRITDLGTLTEEGGYESWANAVNSGGQVVGWTTNTVSDSNSMAAPGFAPTQTRAFLWQHGAMQDLGTLGMGTDAISEFLNERGQVVGYSYTGTPKTSFCIFPETTHSFIWDEKNKMRDLGTLGGSCTIATGINDNGVVVGDNVNDQAQRAFLWKDGAIQDLGGSIGGQNAGAQGISQSGQVAGFATLPGEVLYHATLWKRVGQMTDLGVIDQDLCSFASSINSKSQVVGASQAGTPENGCTFDNTTTAFLWQNGSIFDLNTLIPPGASLHLQWAQSINDRGEIAGSGLDAAGNVHDFLLIPCATNSATDCQEVIAGAAAETQTRPASLMQRPQIVNRGNLTWQMLHRQLGPLDHIPGLAPRN
jgi:probable HAF family extracellular repeat protein